MVSEKLCNFIKWQMLGGSNLTMCCSVCFRRTCTQHCTWDRRELETLAGTVWGCSRRNPGVLLSPWGVGSRPGGDTWPRGCVVTCSWEKVLSHGSAPLGNGVPSTQGKVADHCIFMVPHPGEDGSEATWDPGEGGRPLYIYGAPPRGRWQWGNVRPRGGGIQGIFVSPTQGAVNSVVENPQVR